MIKAIRNKITLALCLLMVVGSVSAKEVVLPINSVSKPYAALQFNAGPKFKIWFGSGEVRDGSEIIGTRIIFIPSNADDLDADFNEGISLVVLKKRKSAKYMITEMLQAIKERNPKGFEVLYEKEINMENYSRIEYVLSYDSYDNRKIIYYITALSGRYDCVAYQYFTHTKDPKTEYKKILEKGRSLGKVINRRAE